MAAREDALRSPGSAGRDMRALLEQVERRRRLFLQGGGTLRIARQHEAGKLTARERIERLVDPGTFVELDAFMAGAAGAGDPARGQGGGVAPDGSEQGEAWGEGVVTGFALVGGRLVFVFSQDFTVFGGSVGELHARRICKVMDMAARVGAPIVGLNDSGGARIQEGVWALDAYGEIFVRNARYSGVVPQISVIMGPCAGGAVYSPAITDFVIMVDATSQMFITGPQVIRSTTGEVVDPERLGGSVVHARDSGVAHLRAPDETSALALVGRLLSFLPQNNLDDPPMATAVPPPGGSDELLDVLPADPTRAYDVREVIRRLVDGGDFLEVHGEFAANAVTSLARIEGRPVGVVANQPAVLAGCLDLDASDKIARFVRVCDAFNVPVVTLVDVPGFLPGVDQEHRGIIRHGAKILYAYSEAAVPKLTVVLRKAYGGAYVALGSRSVGADLVLAWPTAELAVMGPEGAARIVYRSEIASAPEPERALAEYTVRYRQRYANPFMAAARGMVDDVIDPRQTRHRLAVALETLASKRETRPARKHGNIPL